MMTLAIIPVRGGSKGVPRKNLRKVGPYTLLERAIRAARDAGVDHIVVSTEDSEIAAEAKRCGVAMNFMRPQALAGDDVPVIPVIEHAIQAFEETNGAEVDVIALIEATVPFRNADHVSEAVAKYRRGGYASVATVCPLERKPENICIKESGRLKRYITEPKIQYTKRQDMTQLCRISSGVYVFGKKDFLRQKSVLLDPIGYVEMSGVESVNIDEEIDLLLADSVHKKFNL